MGSEFALATAFFFSSGVILTRRALVYCSPSSATLFSYAIHCAYFWGLTMAFGSLSLFDWRALVFFVFAGFLAPGLGRWLRVISMDRVGAPISSAVLGSTPLFAFIPALIVLGEKMSMQLFVGSLFVILGVFILHLRTGGRNPIKTGIMLSLISAICFGASATLRKIGLNLVASPIVAGAIGASTSLLVFSTLFWMSNVTISMNREAFRLLFPASILEALGFTTLFYGYSVSGVILTESLVNMAPLLVIFMSMIFLREFEKVTLPIILGAITIITGAALVILS